jgi:hypothetical protein
MITADRLSRETLLADAPVFDPLSAPVFSEVGYLAEVFRRAPGTLVSDNPSGRIGANTDTTTVLHYAEYRADVPNRRRVRRHYRCKSAGGSAIRAVECLDDEEGIVHVDGEDYFAYLERLFGTRKGPAWPGRRRGGRTYRGCRYRKLRRAADDPEPLAAIDRSQTSQRLTLRQRRTGKG